MNYSQLREEIREKIWCTYDDKQSVSLRTQEAEEWLMKEIMTAIDTYLEEKAVEVENPDFTSVPDNPHNAGRVLGRNEAAAIIRSKE